MKGKTKQKAQQNSKVTSVYDSQTCQTSYVFHNDLFNYILNLFLLKNIQTFKKIIK